MKCPYCGKYMKKGFIPGDRYALKWIPEEKYKGVILQWFVKGIKLTGIFLKSEVEGFLCEGCKKIIIDVGDRFE